MDLADIATTPPSDRAVVALDSTRTEQHLARLLAQAREIEDVAGKTDRERAHELAMKMRAARVAIARVGKGAREDSQAFCAAVIAEERRLIALVEPEERRVLALRDAYDERIAAEKRAREEAERRRVQGLRDAVTAIERLPVQRRNEPSAVLAEVIAVLEAKEITEEEFQELRAEAVRARSASLDELRALHAAALSREAEAKRLAEERAELQRLRAEQEARDRAAAEQRAAELAALREQQAEIDRQREELERTVQASRSEAEPKPQPVAPAPEDGEVLKLSGATRAVPIEAARRAAPAPGREMILHHLDVPLHCGFEYDPGEPAIHWPTDAAHPGAAPSAALLTCLAGGVDILPLLSDERIGAIEAQIIDMMGDA